MSTDLQTSLKNRRSYYDITSKSPIPDDQIHSIINFAVLNTPSAFNSQSARVVLLLGDQHTKLWEIIRETLRKIVPADKFKPTDDKINSFAAGHGSVLFYEDQATIRELQKNFPLYKDAFPGFSENSAGMLQLVVWVMLRDAGLGASLQHYGNLIQDEVAKTWGLDPDWKLIAQMPFGAPASEPGSKESLPLEKTVRVFS
ncbi:MAG: nitroreductase family protein [Planctomycetota bacterium]|jgi:predicted oxidoreductase (fatty acid repression mutant protein)|nr:nitroreductase family protein [Planctomycetota bacterium]